MSNYFRPDAVYRTGVVQSAAGFNPQQAVMDNAARFTQYPYNQTFDTNSLQTALGGPMVLMGTPQLMGIGLIDRVKLWFASRRAASAARKFQSAAATVAAVTNPGGHAMPPQAVANGLTPNGPASVMGPAINSMPSQRLAMLRMIAQRNMPVDWNANALDTIANRWNGKG